MFQKVIFVFVLMMLCFSMNSKAQLTGTGCPGMTQYTDGQPNDAIYYYEPGATGSLTATPESGVPGWNYVWSRFVVGTSSWTFYSSENNVASSTISNLSAGAYGVTITDANGDVVGCYQAWIVQVLTEPSVDVDPIPSACNGPVMLNGTINYGTVTPYSNLPASQMLIDANTSISICFSGIHTWVSDLAFYAIGPASCGSPTLTLMPNPGALGQGSVCNSGDNISSLCFSSESSNNINVCNGAPSTLSGTFGTYGPSSTPINWGAFNGCEATSGGWSVQIYDCIGGDVGALTDATITFSGTDACGTDQTITYTTPPGYSSAIFDNTCSAATASIFSVPAPPPYPAIVCNYGFEWNSDPYVFIEDSTSSLQIQLDSFVDASGNVMPWQSVLFSLEITTTCDTAVSSESGCFGGNAYDEELFNVIPLEQVIFDPVSTLCESSPSFNFVVNLPGGTYTGAGITDAVNGVFSPALAGIGIHTVSYDTNNPCYLPGSIDIEVVAVPQLDLDFPAGLCIDAPSVQLESLNPNNGTYSGNGITDVVLGEFDPAVAGIGLHSITIDIGGICPNSASQAIEVYPLPNVSAGVDDDVCAGSVYTLNASGAESYQWNPTTYLDDHTIPNPNVSLLADISYTVIGTSIFGCQSSDDVQLNLLPLPTVEVEEVSEVCPGTGVILQATGSVGNYSWTPSIGVANANSATATAEPTITTTYTVTVTDNCNLQVSETLTVPVELVYTVDAGEDVVYCDGESVLLQSTVTGSNPTLQWSTSNGVLNGSGQATSMLISEPGDYIMTVTTPLGCQYSDAVEITETALPFLNLVNDVLLCPGGDVTLHAGYNWDVVLWANGETTPDITVYQDGEYAVTVTENDCQSSASILVNLVFLPYVELGSDIEICDGDQALISAGVEGSWSTGIFDSAITVSGEGAYSVVVQSGPCSVTDSIHVAVLPLPFVELGAPLTGCVDQSVSVSALHPDNETYLWSTGEQTDFITVFSPDIYFVTVGNECGTMTDFVDVAFEDCSFSIYIPNSFTPDYDGINDVWQISTFNVVKLELSIFNRWGDVLFTSTDPQTVWTGQVESGDYFVPDGVYHYRLTYETGLKELGERSGSITVIR